MNASAGGRSPSFAGRITIDRLARFGFCARGAVYGVVDAPDLAEADEAVARAVRPAA